MKRSVARSGKKRWLSEAGQTMVEFSLVAIVFFMVLFGIMDTARLFQSWVTVQHAARDSARFAVTGLATCAGDDNRPDCIVWVAKKGTTGLTGGGVGSTAVTVTTKAWDWNGTGWSSTADLNKQGKGCDQIEVTVQYTHRFVTPFLEAIAPGGVTLRGIQRMTNEPFDVCNPNDTTG